MSNSDSSSSAFSGGYKKQFQMAFLTHLVHCEELLKCAVGQVRVTDFELPIYQIIYEGLEIYYRQYRRMPTMGELKLQVVKIIQDIKHGSATYQSHVTPEEHEGLTNTLSLLGAQRVEGLNVEFYRNELPIYLRTIRSQQCIAKYQAAIDQDQMPTELYRELAQIDKETSSMGEKKTMQTIVENHGVIMKEEDINVVSTGCTSLDAILDGGLGIGELGLVTGCPGRGKTNVMVHFSCAATLSLNRSLLISLELDGNLIRRRHVAMAACIDGPVIKRPISLWKTEEISRLAMIINEEYAPRDFFTVSDLSDKTQTLSRIEQEIETWKEHTARTLGEDAAAECQLVCIDWLDLLLGPKRQDVPRWDEIAEICQALRQIGKRHGVAMWTATQGNRGADKKTVLGMDDVGGGYRKNEAIDIGIGLGLLEEDKISGKNLKKGRILPWQGNPNDIVTDKHVVFSINKHRNGSTGIVKLYQAPNLRFYDSNENYLVHRKAIGDMGVYDAAMGYAINAAGGKEKFTDQQLGELKYGTFTGASAPGQIQ